MVEEKIKESEESDPDDALQVTGVKKDPYFNSYLAGSRVFEQYNKYTVYRPIQSRKAVHV